ncbi:MAG: anthranilate phosphoribosyltransferase [Comamonas sp.]
MIKRDKVDVIVGTVHSGVAMAMAKAAKESGTVLIVPNAGADAVTGPMCAPNIFRSSFTNWQTAYPMGVVAAKEGKKNAMTLTWKYAAGEEAVNGFKEGFEKNGGKVSKHGGRSVSSKSGSADAMEALGININLQPTQIADCIRDVGIGFMFAPNHHPAMKNVAPVRKELGVRTIFNILGPLTNPASAPNILMGVFHEDLVGIQVRALQRLGAEHALVVYGRDGLDEISLGAGTLVGELKDGVVREYEVHPEDFGLRMAGTRSLKVENPEESKAMLLGVLQGEQGPARDIVCLNAGAALYAANVASSIEDGLDRAQKAIDSGAALVKLKDLVSYSQKLSTAA